MGVKRQPVVGMGLHSVKSLPDLADRVYVHRHLRDMGDMVQDLVADLFGNAVSLGDTQGWVHGDVDLEVEPVAAPAGAHLGNLTDPRSLMRDLLGVFQNSRLHAVQHSREDRPGRLPHKREDYECDQEPNEWISKGVAEPHARSTD